MDIVDIEIPMQHEKEKYPPTTLEHQFELVTDKPEQSCAKIRKKHYGNPVLRDLLGKHGRK